MIIRICLLTTLLFNYIHTRRLTAVLVPERGNVTSWSDKYLYYARGYVTRTSRKSPYYINVEGKIKHTWGNNVTGEYHLLNMTIPMDEFKYTIPFERFRLDLEITHTDTKESMATGYGYGRFKPAYTDN
ncbi:unnamed protein product [Diatraea saccharalis]|uniref:Uncharacterized protein n=1 Tax=Diatraea saccharalis TaxID=40085 RepID=A0A9N9WJD8_9NEOP|nr:unnamed protein product [Diatraea saccharalis]